MSGKIVNLRQIRKRKARDEKARQGDENAAAHGRSKAERSITDLRAVKAQRDLDGHKRED